MVFFNNTWKLYELMCKCRKEGICLSIEGLSKKINWTKIKTKRHIKKLLKGGLIKCLDLNSILYIPKTVKELRENED